MKRKLKGLVIAGSLLTSGCLRELPVYLENSPIANGYDIMYHAGGENLTDKEGTEIRIGRFRRDNTGDFRGVNPVIYALDFDGDQRVDELRTHGISPGDPLESLASVSEVNRILAETYKQVNKLEE